MRPATDPVRGDDSKLASDSIPLPCITCHFPDKVGGHNAEDHDADEKGIHNPVGHPSSRLPERNQSRKKRNPKDNCDDELGYVGNAN